MVSPSFEHIKMWCKALTQSFYEADKYGNGLTDVDEFRKMINKLPINKILKVNLQGQFKEVNLYSSGVISLAECLFFFLQHKPCKVELNADFHN